MYKKLILVIALFGLINFCFSQTKTMKTADNTLSQSEKSNGWKLLFDGRTTNGWHSYGSANVRKAWTVNDGTFYMDAEAKKNLASSEGGDLVTNEEYANFDLKVDWKISPKGNSGIIFYIHEDTSKYHNTYNTGLEMQVLDNGTPTNLGHPDAKLYTHRAGDLYDLLAAKEAAHLQGEWNHVEIRSLNGKLDFYLNDVHTLSVNLWDDNWRQMIAISKFKNMPGFGTFKKGKISLQEHDETVWYKNIKIKKL